MLRKIRIFVLLMILATVGLGGWRSAVRLASWEQTVHVAIYPIAADASPRTARFLAELDREQFAEIGEWLQEQSREYGRTVLQPVYLNLAPVVKDSPPLPPTQGGVAEAIVWSLQLRWWAAQHDAIGGPKPDVRLFVLFHDVGDGSALPHSTGLEKGQIGVIHLFADRSQRQQNAVVIAHELLHTFGAKDKYDLTTLQPIFPHGYAEPALSPRLPQRLAEIMAGRIPTGEGRAEIPASLAETVIGAQTAKEIGLVRTEN